MINALLVLVALQRAGMGAWDTGQASREPLSRKTRQRTQAVLRAPSMHGKAHH